MGKQELNQSHRLLISGCDSWHKQLMNKILKTRSISHPVNVIKVNLTDADAGIHTNYTALLAVVASIQLSIARAMSILLVLTLPGTRETGLASLCVCVMLTISSLLLFSARG